MADFMRLESLLQCSANDSLDKETRETGAKGEKLRDEGGQGVEKLVEMQTKLVASSLLASAKSALLHTHSERHGAEVDSTIGLTAKHS